MRIGQLPAHRQGRDWPLQDHDQDEWHGGELPRDSRSGRAEVCELGKLRKTKEDSSTPLSVKFSGSNFLIQTSGGGYPGGDGTSIAGGFDYEID